MILQQTAVAWVEKERWPRGLPPKHDVKRHTSLLLATQIGYSVPKEAQLDYMETRVVSSLHACSARLASTGVSAVPAFDSTKLSITRASIPEQK